MAGRRTAAQRASAPRGGTGAGDDAPWLDDEEQQLFLTFASALVQVPNSLDAQLTRDAGISHFEYLVMAVLSMASERTLRMSELAEVTDSALSRLSNVATRLEKRGWIRRTPDPTNGRYTLASLTDDGHGQGDRLGTGPREARPPDDSRPPDRKPSNASCSRSADASSPRWPPKRVTRWIGSPDYRRIAARDAHEHLSTVAAELNSRRFRRRRRMQLRSLLARSPRAGSGSARRGGAAADGGSMGMIRLCTAGLHAACSGAEGASRVGAGTRTPPGPWCGPARRRIAQGRGRDLAAADVRRGGEALSASGVGVSLMTDAGALGVRRVGRDRGGPAAVQPRGGAVRRRVRHPPPGPRPRSRRIPGSMARVHPGRGCPRGGLGVLVPTPGRCGRLGAMDVYRTTAGRCPRMLGLALAFADVVVETLLDAQDGHRGTAQGPGRRPGPSLRGLPGAGDDDGRPRRLPGRRARPVACVCVRRGARCTTSRGTSWRSAGLGLDAP